MKDKRCWYRTDERQAGLYIKKPLRSGEEIKDAEVTNLQVK